MPNLQALFIHGQRSLRMEHLQLFMGHFGAGNPNNLRIPQICVVSFAACALEALTTSTSQIPARESIGYRTEYCPYIARAYPSINRIFHKYHAGIDAKGHCDGGAGTFVAGMKAALRCGGKASELWLPAGECCTACATCSWW